jgi:hypothetical protein
MTSPRQSVRDDPDTGGATIKRGAGYRTRRDDMHRIVRALGVALAVLVTVTTAAVVSPTARAAANGPRWTSGDFWAYNDLDANGNVVATLRTEVVGRENVATLLGNIYDAFHFRETRTSGSFAFTTDTWVRDADLGLVKISFTIGPFTTNTTFDPPQSHASFPLVVGKSWSLALRRSVQIGNGNTNTVSLTYGARVDNELDVTVPAGTFRSASVNETTTGSYTKFYFSEQVGWWSKQERYNPPNQKTGETVLTQYRYQWNTTFLAIIGAIVAVIAIVVIAFLYKKRKKAVGLPGGPMPPR